MTLRSNALCHCSSVTSSMVPGGEDPALLTRMSTPPSPAMHSPTVRSTPAAVLRSPTAVTTSPVGPQAAHSPATCCSRPSSRPIRATRAPSAASARAVAAPIPRLAPVTIARRPASPSSTATYPARRSASARAHERQSRLCVPCGARVRANSSMQSRVIAGSSRNCPRALLQRAQRIPRTSPVS